MFCCVYCYVFVNSLCEAFVSVFVSPLCLCELSMGSLGLSDVSSMYALARMRERRTTCSVEIEFSKFIYRSVKAK